MRMLMIALLALACTSLLAEEPTKTQTQVESPGESMMVVVKDPTTGEYRTPTAEEMAKIQAQMTNNTKQQLKPMETFHHKDGTVTVRLNGRFMSYTIAKKQPDGSMKLDCVKTPQEMVNVLNRSEKEVRSDR